jgi:hypothetical protein
MISPRYLRARCIIYCCLLLTYCSLSIDLLPLAFFKPPLRHPHKQWEYCYSFIRSTHTRYSIHNLSSYLKMIFLSTYIFRFFPSVRDRLNKSWLEIDQCVLQFLTWHGSFKTNIYSFKLVHQAHLAYFFTVTNFVTEGSQFFINLSLLFWLNWDLMTFIVYCQLVVYHCWTWLHRRQGVWVRVVGLVTEKKT